MGGFQLGLLDTTRADAGVCITSIKLCAKCLTTANIPFPPADPIDASVFVIPLKKQSSCCLAPLRCGNGETLSRHARTCRNRVTRTSLIKATGDDWCLTALKVLRFQSLALNVLQSVTTGWKKCFRNQQY